VKTRILDSDGELKPGARKMSDTGERESFAKEGAVEGGAWSLSLSLALFRANSSIPRAPTAARSAVKYVTDTSRYVQFSTFPPSFL
jgi:hypothetical protein